MARGRRPKRPDARILAYPVAVMASAERTREPQFVSLPVAVREIAQAVRGAAAGEFPFVLIVGAGISAPAVPLADGLVARCQQRCRDLGVPDEDLPSALGDPLERYAAWFKAAFPQRGERQRFFSALIENAPLSPAVVRLAHLLLRDAQPPRDPAASGPGGELQAPLANVAITPNFDDLLARALRLFGADTVICDHPRTTERIDPNRRDVLQLVHVHGSFRHYDGCNLRDEIEARARPASDGGEGMLGLLQSLLRDRSPLVVGYAGWQGDVIMTALERRLRDRASLPCNLYWFCYRRGEADSLPAWLTGHPDVRCVVAPSVPRERAAESAGAPRMSDTPDEPDTLPAARVFEGLIHALGLRPPRLTDNPLTFFAEHLEGLLPREEPGASGDIYNLRDVVRRVRRGVELEQRAREAESQAQREGAERLKQVLDAVRGADFVRAVEVARTVPLDGLDENGWASLEAALQQVDEALLGQGLAGQGGDALAACELRVSLAERPLKRAPESLDWRVRHARALHGVGYCHSVAGRHHEALAAYEHVLNLYGNSPEPELQERVARSLVNKGVALGALGRSEDELAVYDDIERRFGSASEPALREQVASALFNKGFVLGTRGRAEDALAAYDEVERRFSSPTDLAQPGIRDAVERARANRAALQTA